MKDPQILKVAEDVEWIGVLDQDLVTFDIVMETRYGTTYNSYFINAEKKAVIDTVKEQFWPSYKEKLLSLTDPREIEYIVLNHTEPDHSGALKHLLDIAPQATVAGSGQALNYLQEMLGHPFRSLKVRDGDVIDLGNRKLRVIGAPNLHWPDTIYTFLENEGILFSCDSFGAHFADERMLDDLVGDFTEAYTYYFNVILKPYSKFMLKALDKIDALPVRMICPGHGPILRTSWKEKMDSARNMASGYIEHTRKSRRILLAYISAYGYTRDMALMLADRLKEKGDLTLETVDIEHMSLGEMEEHLVRADGILIGSPTINQNTLLPVYKLFSVINPIRDKGKPVAVFGSFGWSGEAVKLIEAHLENLKMNVIGESWAARFYPHQDESDEIDKLVTAFTSALQESAESS